VSDLRREWLARCIRWVGNHDDRAYGTDMDSIGCPGLFAERSREPILEGS
jgi:hypothetical protein